MQPKVVQTSAKISPCSADIFRKRNASRGRERAYGGTGNRAESRSISTTRWSLFFAPTGTDMKIISSSSTVYENSIVKHDLVDFALNVIVVNLSRCDASDSGMFVFAPCTVDVPITILSEIQKFYDITNKIKSRNKFEMQPTFYGNALRKLRVAATLR